jgi:thioesterase domain-containing protein
LWNLNLIAIRRALRDYAVRPSRARIVLLEAHDPRLGPLPPTVWARLAGGVDVYPVTAIGVGHVSIMWQPYVDQLSAIFQEQLALAMQLAAPFLGG